MSANPYKPPTAELADLPKPPGSAIKAVLVGLVVDIGGTMLVGIVISIVYSIYWASTGMSQTQIEAAFEDVGIGSSIFIVGTVFGTLMSILGGFVCARISRRKDYKLGFVLATISVIIALLVSLSYPLPTLVLLLAITFAAVLLGTKLGRVK
ncbi:MAG TPA: hypothetical protein VJU83_03415 [Burkholderiales bacterium]|nr:hypothetical protein [Burkholderiales bacterium]